MSLLIPSFLSFLGLFLSNVPSPGCGSLSPTTSMSVLTGCWTWWISCCWCPDSVFICQVQSCWALCCLAVKGLLLWADRGNSGLKLCPGRCQQPLSRDRSAPRHRCGLPGVHAECLAKHGSPLSRWGFKCLPASRR